MSKSQIDNLMQTMADDGVKVVRNLGISHETWHGFEPTEVNTVNLNSCYSIILWILRKDTV